MRMNSFRPGRPAHVCGHGYFAGEPPATSDPDDPDGRAKILNVPSRVRVSIYERQTMQCLGTTLSGADGRWRVAGLLPSLPFTVIGFDSTQTVNAAIQDWVKPAPYDPADLRVVQLVSHMPNADLGAAVSRKVRAANAVGNVTFTVTAGALPDGWSLDSQDASCVLTGTSTTAGIYTFELTGTDEAANEASKSYTVEVREAFAYWRIVVTANNGHASFCTIVNLELRENLGWVDQCSGGVALATSFANADNRPEYAFDNDPASKWTSANAPTVPAPQALQYQFVAPVSVREIAITGAVAGQTTMAPRDFTVERSIDGVSWEIAGTFAGVAGWAENETRLFAL